jgi:hypothetical protein
MSIKQLGGVFGRNPTFNDVTIEGELTFDGDIDINSDLKVDGDFEVTGTATIDGLSSLNGGAKVSGGALPVSTAGLFTASDLSTGKLTSGGASKANSITTYYDDTYIEIVAGVSVGYMSGISLGGRTYAGTGADAITLSPRGVPALTLAGSTGAATFADNIIIGTSGKGIDFSATAGTGTSELLDDYEEGIHTATLTPTTSGTIGLAGSANSLSYTKIGNMVNVTGYLYVSAISSPVGAINVSLPFAAADLIDGAGGSAAALSLTNIVSANVSDFVGRLSETSSDLALYLGSSNNISATSAQQMQVGSQIQISVTYRTA